MLLIILVVYLVVAIVAFMLQLFLNGSFDQSKEPVKLLLNGL
jgi:flagellar basal body-associated protein FliL